MKIQPVFSMHSNMYAGNSKKEQNFKAHLGLYVTPADILPANEHNTFNMVMSKFAAWLETQHPENSIVFVRKAINPKYVPQMVLKGAGGYVEENRLENLEISMDGNSSGFYWNCHSHEDSILNNLKNVFNCIKPL